MRFVTIIIFYLTHFCDTGTCLDADVMTTTNGISMARLEVEGDWDEECSVSRPPRDDPARAALGPDESDPMESNHQVTSNVSPQHPLVDLLSSGIAHALAVETEDHRDGRQCTGRDVSGRALSGGGEDECRSNDGGSDDHPAPCKKAKATAATGADIRFPTGAYPLEAFSSSPRFLEECGDQEKIAPSSAAALRCLSLPESPVVGQGGTGGENGGRGDTTCVLSQGEQGCSTTNGMVASGRRPGEAMTLARRESCVFLAETDANAFSGKACVAGAAISDNAFGGSPVCGGSRSGVVHDDCIDPEHIELLELVGEGRFSRTHRARLHGVTVAVKTVELPEARPAVEMEGAAEGWEAALAKGSEGRRLMLAEFERELVINSVQRALVRKRDNYNRARGGSVVFEQRWVW